MTEKITAADAIRLLDTVKAVAILRHVIDSGDGIVQQREAAAHIFNVGDIFGRCFVWDRSAVETE